MSEVMTQAIIGMPYEMAMADELSKRQFHGCAQSLLDGYAALEAENERLRNVIKILERDVATAHADELCAMGYLSEVRAIVGGDDFPSMVERVLTMKRDKITDHGDNQ